MLSLTDDQDARCLMPGPEHQLFAVLIHGSTDENACSEATCFHAYEWPDDFVVAELNRAKAVQTAKWFGFGQEAAMAVIFDGVVLALDTECTDEACERLVRVAREQLIKLQNA